MRARAHLNSRSEYLEFGRFKNFLYTARRQALPWHNHPTVLTSTAAQLELSPTTTPSLPSAKPSLRLFARLLTRLTKSACAKRNPLETLLAKAKGIIDRFFHNCCPFIVGVLLRRRYAARLYLPTRGTFSLVRFRLVSLARLTRLNIPTRGESAKKLALRPQQLLLTSVSRYPCRRSIYINRPCGSRCRPRTRTRATPRRSLWRVLRLRPASRAPESARRYFCAPAAPSRCRAPATLLAVIAMPMPVPQMRMPRFRPCSATSWASR